MTKKLGLTLPYATNSERESVTGIPFTYPPGERWHYGTSNDWLALVIEKASGEKSLEEYFQKNIFGCVLLSPLLSFCIVLTL
jgi:CubicO group peptidase (beta-lactamase class C family)